MAAISLQRLRKLTPTVGASQTDQPIAQLAPQAGTALRCRISLVCSSVTVSAGITVNLQHRAIGATYTDVGSANGATAIVGNGEVNIVLLVERAADQVDLPLHQDCRLVVTTGAGDTVTFDEITVQQF